jgi:hypothetical protein
MECGPDQAGHRAVVGSNPGSKPIRKSKATELTSEPSCRALSDRTVCNTTDRNRWHMRDDDHSEPVNDTLTDQRRYMDCVTLRVGLPAKTQAQMESLISA